MKLLYYAEIKASLLLQLRLPFDQFPSVVFSEYDNESFAAVNGRVHGFDRLYNHNNISSLVSFIVQLSQSYSAIRIKHF